MRTTSVGPEEPIHQLAIKLVQIVSQEQTMGIHEGLKEGAIEPFDLRVHFGTSRVGMEMNDPVIG